MRVEPVPAIRSGHGADLRHGGPFASRLPWPAAASGQYPLPNLCARPRRTMLTALAIGAAITVLVGVFGMLDSFTRTIESGDHELTRTAPDRLTVQLATLEPLDGPSVTAIAATPQVATVSPGLLVPAELRREGHEPVEIVLESLEATAPWMPEVATASSPRRPAASCWPRRRPATSASGRATPSCCTTPAVRGSAPGWSTPR